MANQSSSNNRLASTAAQTTGGLAADPLFDSALSRPLVHNKGRLEGMTDTFLAAGKIEV